MVDDLRKQRLDSLKQGPVGAIAETDPHDRGRDGALANPVREVFVFCDDDGLMLDGVTPNRRVAGVPQADAGNVLGLMAVSGDES